ncbi:MULTISPECIES: tetratricopeptide repeat protein [Gulbenkiania]|uniref:Tetratricopeptide repeat n=2 Tax=Gulbenkiania TaxID=397456 RepID=A0A0K6H151_9NEIS|nr:MULTISPECIES: tetratricopeptide repeat protein [Gulbenkiania]TCW31351.1 tetratricopeptide repeat protein [Gulbenkiania mobilis]CUA84703.1 Tetratricopeptide repeat [Gulbenkiania indica]
MLEKLLEMVGTARDSAMLRLGIATEMLRAGRVDEAETHLRAALAMQPGYSAAWKLLGKGLAEAGRTEEALAAYRQGIQVAQERGDLQAAKEMTVFARRLERTLDPDKPAGEA